MMRVFIILYAAAAAYRIINDFRPQPSGSLSDNFKTVSSEKKEGALFQATFFFDNPTGTVAPCFIDFSGF